MQYVSVSACGRAFLNQHAKHIFRATPYCHLWIVCLYHIFPHYLVNGKFFGKKLAECKLCVSLLIFKISTSYCHKFKQITLYYNRENIPFGYFIHFSASINVADYFLGWGGRDSPQWAMGSSFTRFLDHTQQRITVGRTPLDEWSARRRDLYLTAHSIHNRQTSMRPVYPNPRSQQASGRRPTPQIARPTDGSEAVRPPLNQRWEQDVHTRVARFSPRSFELPKLEYSGIVDND